jgi:major vault protein
MAERGSRKIPVTERQFLWVQDDDKGEVILHVGPTMVSPTAADRIVVDDGQGGLREDLSNQPQQMVELSDSQYAVLSNPMVEREEGPNGKFRAGRNESRLLRHGTRHMIPGPCSFYLRPGQRVEIRDAHELASNQYLVVKVYGEVDRTAPYYEITGKSAAITTATAEDIARTGSSSAGLGEAEPVDLKRGQLIVIRGLDTQFYIPPTGVDVVPDLSIDDKGTALTAEAARKILQTVPRPAGPELALGAASGGGMLMAAPAAPAAEAEAPAPQARDKRSGRLAGIEQSARSRQAVQRQPAPPAEVREEEPALSDDEMQTLLQSDVHRAALEREVRKARLVRRAVVLGEKEFCVILDADGKRQIKVGPARVFPGPYDSFQTRGSNDRIYYAYELLPQRALWLRFIAPIARERLVHKLPRGVEMDEETYLPGDELILTGVNSFFFPFNEIEILHPLTGQPHVGNDHADVFIEAIGIDQKSGIYVRDLSTGEVRLIRGKQSYLVDPRKEVHITRSLSSEHWNLWIAHGEPHKQTRSAVTTPWAISITVPHNTAVLAASADGQRVIDGPCVELLGYEETLVPMRLSTGKPKSGQSPLNTCFLRTVGNQVSDVIRLETADFVEMDVRVSYRVHFEPQLRERWFNHEDYVGVLCDHLRSLVRGRCRSMALGDLWTQLPTIVRDIILGERTDSGRKGRLFDENGMRVTEVEVLSGEILDEEIAQLLETVQRESVSLQISDRHVSEQLRSEKLRHTVDLERLTMKREAHERQAALAELVGRIEQAARMVEIRSREQAALEASELESRREALLLQARLDREASESEATVARLVRELSAEIDAKRQRDEREEAHRRALAELQVLLLQTQSAATVAERQAVQPALVEALSALGDKLLLSEVAQNMNLVTLFKGKDVATLFHEMLGGTKLGQTIEAMLPSAGREAGGAGPAGSLVAGPVPADLPPLPN